ncbi:MAG TPA: hypothetical protein VIV60_01230, partial [Polyangiaceae bacterium]
SCINRSSGTCWESSDGSRGCSTPISVSTCQPKYYATRDYGTATTANGSVDSTGSTPAPTVPGTDKSGGEAANAANGDNDAAATSMPTDASNVSGGGCSVAQGSQQKTSSLLMLMLTLGFGLRLRRRSAHS